MATVPIDPNNVSADPAQPAYRGSGTPAAFGQLQSEALSNAGSALGKFSDTAANIAIRQQETRDAVMRARDLTNFSVSGNQALDSWAKGTDISDPNSAQDFATQMTDAVNKTVAEHQGSARSQALLSVRLNRERTELVNTAVARSNVAQGAAVSHAIGSNLTPLSAQAYQHPETLTDLMGRWDGVVADLQPGIGTDAAMRATNQGHEQIASSAVQKLIDTGQLDEAQRQLDLLSKTDILTPSTQQSFASHLTIARIAQQRALSAGTNKLAEAEQIVGRPLSDTEKTKLAGIEQPQGPQSLSSRIAQLEVALGRPLTQQETLKIGDAMTPEDHVFGNGLPGRALGILNDLAPAYGHNLLTPEEENKFQTALTVYTQPTTIKNPDTGLIETKVPVLPPFIQDAIKARGGSIPQTGAPMLPPQPGAVSPPGPLGAAATPSESPGAGSVAPGANSPPPAPAAPSAAAPAPSGQSGVKTIWDMANNGTITGAIPALGAAVGRLPGVGDVVPSKQMTQNRAQVGVVQETVVNALRQSTRYAEGERKDISGDVDLMPRPIDTAKSYVNRLIGLDDALAQRENNAIATAQNPATGQQERTQALNAANNIVQVRKMLGVPPLAATRQDVLKLPKGTLFRTPMGTLRWRL